MWDAWVFRMSSQVIGQMHSNGAADSGMGTPGFAARHLKCGIADGTACQYRIDSVPHCSAACMHLLSMKLSSNNTAFK
jgi:hypothetical protein